MAICREATGSTANRETNTAALPEEAAEGTVPGQAAHKASVVTNPSAAIHVVISMHDPWTVTMTTPEVCTGQAKEVFISAAQNHLSPTSGIASGTASAAIRDCTPGNKVADKATSATADSTPTVAATTRTIDCCYPERQADNAQDWSDANGQLSAAPVTNGVGMGPTHVDEIASETWQHRKELPNCTCAGYGKREGRWDAPCLRLRSATRPGRAHRVLRREAARH